MMTNTTIVLTYSYGTTEIDIKSEKITVKIIKYITGTSIVCCTVNYIVSGRDA